MANINENDEHFADIESIQYQSSLTAMSVFTN
jgi:hypothetical protein